MRRNLEAINLGTVAELNGSRLSFRLLRFYKTMMKSAGTAITENCCRRDNLKIITVCRCQQVPRSVYSRSKDNSRWILFYAFHFNVQITFAL